MIRKVPLKEALLILVLSAVFFLLVACSGNAVDTRGLHERTVALTATTHSSSAERRRVVTAIVTMAPTPTLMACTDNPNGPVLKLLSKGGLVEGSGFAPGEILEIRLLCTTARYGSESKSSDYRGHGWADKEGNFRYDGIGHVLESWEMAGVPPGTKVTCHLSVGHSKGVACLDVELRVP